MRVNRRLIEDAAQAWRAIAEKRVDPGFFGDIPIGEAMFFCCTFDPGLGSVASSRVHFGVLADGGQEFAYLQSFHCKFTGDSRCLETAHAILVHFLAPMLAQCTPGEERRVVYRLAPALADYLDLEPQKREWMVSLDDVAYVLSESLGAKLSLG